MSSLLPGQWPTSARPADRRTSPCRRCCGHSGRGAHAGLSQPPGNASRPLERTTAVIERGDVKGAAARPCHVRQVRHAAERETVAQHQHLSSFAPEPHRHLTTMHVPCGTWIWSWISLTWPSVPFTVRARQFSGIPETKESKSATAICLAFISVRQVRSPR